eukprot:COSAG01_NODE_530_length_15875_cov_27.779982_2_plen_700_part_00
MKIAYAVVNTDAPQLVNMPDCRISASLSDFVASALQRDLAQRYLSAAAMQSALRLATELPDNWAAMDEETNCIRVPISRDTDCELWTRVERRIAESLPDFALVGITRVQNKALWQKYSTYCAGQESVNESELFHYAEPDTVDKIVSSSTAGLDPRLGGGEYGAGAYFAKHAVYCVAYSAGWLSDDVERDAQGREAAVPNRSIERERAASPNVTLIWAKVALGHCKNFGARCRSARGDAAADEQGVGRGLDDVDDWGPAIGRDQESSYHRPPPRGQSGLYDSVTGTEGDLAWAAHPRLRDKGTKFGRQYVTFHPDQAYPELLLQLERRLKATQQFRYAEEQEAIGKSDKEMEPGTTVYVKGYGYGVVCPGYVASFLPFQANTHSLRFGHECTTIMPGVLDEVQLKLREHTWHVVGHNIKHYEGTLAAKHDRLQHAVRSPDAMEPEPEPNLRMTVVDWRSGVREATKTTSLFGGQTPRKTLECIDAVQQVQQCRSSGVTSDRASSSCANVYNLIVLSDGSEAAIAAAVADAGGVEALIGVLRAYPTSRSVNVWGCDALRELVDFHAPSKNRALDTGAAELAQTAMQYFAQGSREHDRAHELLASLGMEHGSHHEGRGLGPLAEWSEAQVQIWLGSLGLSESAAVTKAFAAEEVNGANLLEFKLRHVIGIIRKAKEPVHDPAGLAQIIIAERDHCGEGFVYI